jgi:hypothetical protein
MIAKPIIPMRSWQGGTRVDGDGDSRHRPDEAGCAYLCDGDGGRQRCSAARRLGSPYCAMHHALCYLAAGSAAEMRRLREIEALAGAVGGRQGPGESRPPPRFLDRLERRVRGFSRVDRSRFVRFATSRAPGSVRGAGSRRRRRTAAAADAGLCQHDAEEA